MHQLASNQSKTLVKSHYSAVQAGAVFIGRKVLVASSAAGLMSGVLRPENVGERPQCPFMKRSNLKLQERVFVCACQPDTECSHTSNLRTHLFGMNC